MAKSLKTPSKNLDVVACYQCGHTHCVKNGLMQGMQRFKCKKCGYNFVDKPRRGHSSSVTMLASWLHLNGLSQRRIARLFGVSPAAVCKWTHQHVANLKRLQGTISEQRITAVDPDEAWHYMKRKPGQGKLIVVIQDAALVGSEGFVIGEN